MQLPGHQPQQRLHHLPRRTRRYLLPWLSPGRWQRRALLVVAALLIGVLAIVFALGADLAIEVHRELMQASPWLTLIIAPGGFALMMWLALRFAPGTLGSGVPQAVAATYSDDRGVRRRLLSLRIALWKIVLTMGALLSGASVGREGPSVQVGASIMNMLGGGRRRTRIASSRTLIAAGGGAGVAAAFNTPLAGILFAIEEMCRFRAFRANSTTLAAVVISGLLSLAVLGSYTYFGRTATTLEGLTSIVPVLLCGALGGLLGGLFCRVLIASARGLPGPLAHWSATFPVRFAAACGLGTALLGLLTGGLVYGTGYAETRAALEGQAALPLYFFAAKMLALWLVFISRIPGGIFAPALAVGAGLGANVAAWLPADQSAAVLTLGMVAFIAAMTQTPITSFVIVMEMTASHQMLLPLMATSLIAYAVSRSVAPVPLYYALARPMLRNAEAAARLRRRRKRHRQQT